mgnify:CR=1 FL=1
MSISIPISGSLTGGSGEIDPDAIVTGALNLYVFGDSIAFQQTQSNQQPNASITGISKANPAVVTHTGHGFETDQQLYFWGVKGMTEINERLLTITVINANSYSLNGVDSTGYTTYTSGGRAHGAVWAASATVNSRLKLGTIDAKGYIKHALKFMGQRFNFGMKNNRGIASETSTMIAARVTESLPVANGITDVYDECGTNDIGVTALTLSQATQDSTFATFQTNVQAIRDYVHNTLKARYIRQTLLPAAATTTSQRDLKDRMNAWLKTLASEVPGREVYIVDAYRRTADPATRDWYTNLTPADGIHPDAAASVVIGQAIEEDLTPFYGVGQYREKVTNLVTNPNFTGTGGTALAISFSGNGNIATGWTATAVGASNNATMALSKNANDEQVCTFNYASTTSDTTNGVNFTFPFTTGLVDQTFYVLEALLDFDGYTTSGATAFPVDLSASLRHSTSTDLSTDGNVISGTPATPLLGTVLDTESGKRYLHLKTFPAKYDSSVMTNLTAKIGCRFKVNVAAGITATLTLKKAQIYPVANPYS